MSFRLGPEQIDDQRRYAIFDTPDLVETKLLYFTARS